MSFDDCVLRRGRTSAGREFEMENAVTVTVKAHRTRNHKHHRAAAKPAACAKPLMLSTVGSKGKRGGG